jgi:acyl-CoA oxidase
MTYDDIETVRVNCGGAGYSVWSQLPQEYYNYSPTPIYEGDNTVMAQQSFSFIEKQLKRIGEGKKATGDFEYLNNLRELCSKRCSAKSVKEFNDLTVLEEAMAVRAAWHVLDVSKKYSESTAHKIVK